MIDRDVKTDFGWAGILGECFRSYRMASMLTQEDVTEKMLIMLLSVM